MNPNPTPPGSATHHPLPNQQPPPVVVNTGTAGAIEAGGNLFSKLGNFTPQQAQTAAVLFLTIFVCFVMGYQFYSGQRSSSETMALLLRTMESEAEKNRATNQTEFERNRLLFQTESKMNRDSTSDLVKLSVESNQKLSTELTRLEQSVRGLDASVRELKLKLPPH